ncbi:MAG TPA: hypothetical protein VD966_12960 [Pyrinomonadaceae bacterium]|nr:hypothetical protein [Pyrinomonadaceae bacterium]
MRQQLGRRILVIVTGLLLSVCPRRRRFAVAQRIAKLLRPLVCRTSLFADQIQFFDDFPEVALRIVYRSMMRLNIGFDPALTVHGAEALGAGGMLILTGHFSLNGLFIRWLSDRGYRVSMVMYSPFREPKVTGTRTPLDVIKSDQI